MPFKLVKKSALVWCLGSLAHMPVAQASEVKLSRNEAWSPELSQAAIEIDDAYEVQLVAAEPLIRDPVEMCWDAQGRCYVVDMIDYPLGGPDGKPLTRIQQLVDTNLDGIYDKAITFAEQLDNAQGVLPYKDGLIVTTRTQVLFLRDSNGDGKADEQKSLIGGFNPSFSQLQVSSPRWGLDGMVYFNNGLDTKEVYPIASDPEGQQKVNAARHNLRWNPRTDALHASSGFGQFGASFDDFGRHYFSSNRSPIMFSVLPQETIMRNAASGLTQAWENIAPDGAASRVYPLQVTHTTSDAHSGTNTSACGITVYRGDLMPELKGHIFVCDPTGQLITQYPAPVQKGASLSTQRLGQNTEFFRSKDEWCRPVNLFTGPDGALYVCDIYRQYIDHARFFPDEFLKTHDIRAGEHQGRIWSIVPKGAKDRLRAAEAVPGTIEDLYAWLGHDNAWQRETAQRVMLEKAENEVEANRLFQVLVKPFDRKQPVSAEAQVTRLWTLAGVWEQTTDREKESFANARWFAGQLGDQVNAVIIENLVKIYERYPELFKNDSQELGKLVWSKGDARSRMLFYACTPVQETLTDEALVRITSNIAELDDPWIQGAVLSHYPNSTGAIAVRLLTSDYTAQASSARTDFIRKLAAAAVSGNNQAVNAASNAGLDALLSTLSQNKGELTWWKAALMQGLAEGLPKSDGSYGGKSLYAFTVSQDTSFAESRAELKLLLSKIESLIDHADTPLDLKLSCVPLLAQQPYEKIAPVLKKLLGSDQPPVLSEAALVLLKRFGAERVAPLLYEIFPSSGPQLRREVITLLAANPKTALDLFQRMERGEIPRSLVDAETRWRYLQSQDPAMKAITEKLFQRPSNDRGKVINDYMASTTMKGDGASGKELFKMVCMTCHRYQGEGAMVGPDITDVRAREKAALLSDILDPNRMIEARWCAYIVELKDGRTLAGLIDSETTDAITLRIPGGATETVDRKQIVSQKSLDTSLMPAGLEGSINLQQMADLLAFLSGES